MPSIKKISCTSGLVHFSVGVSEQQVEDFLNRNKIKREEGSPKWMTSGGVMDENKPSKAITTIRVPPADEYIVPDDVWIWIERDLHF